MTETASPIAARLFRADAEIAFHAARDPATNQKMRALAERLSMAETNPAAGEARSQNEADGGAKAPGDAPKRPAPTGREDSGPAGESGSASTDELWGRIAPCWREMGARSPVSVSLEVSLNGRGGLSTPPRILRREDARLDDLRLRAEERALAALAACMPRNDVRFGGRTYRLDFPAAPAAERMPG